jgi:hypothetical protein
MSKSITIHVQTQDRKIYRKDLLVNALLTAINADKDLIIDFFPEGSCAHQLGLYRMLDELCRIHNYNGSRITIRTANLLENHDVYQIVKCANYWYEVDEIHNWLLDNPIDTGITPNKNFGCFVSRTTWARLWVSTYLDKHYANKTLQTYHYDRTRENYNGNGYVGLDDLFKFNCNIIPDCANFLMTCPRTIDLDFLKTADTSTSMFQHKDSYYPIQVPANLNLLKFYKNIFVDIVVEPNTAGNNFLVTEKLWRCIIARRPFIVLGPANYIYNLRKLGFDTFYNYWSEDYDGQIGQTRISMMLKLIDQIATWDLEKCSNTLTNMKKILDHNYQTFMNLNINDVEKIFTNAK